MSTFSVVQFVDFLNTALTSAVFPEGAIVEGEVTEYRMSQGKWIWFLLKDDDATISCFATVWTLKTPLEDGMKIRVHAKPKVHPRSGKFSLNVEAVELVGEGALRRAFELLKKKLEEEGLFSLERKREIPRFPAKIGLIASGESAAYSDFLRILSDRWGGVTINHAHVQVQGKDAEEDIVRAFSYFNAHPEVADVVVLTRGGGSMEDLQAFNSEDVARAVFGSKIPVVVGVGHERDETLVDLVADVRASTPTNAAERVVPDRAEILEYVEGAMRRMAVQIDSLLSMRSGAIEHHVARMETQIQRQLQLFHNLTSRLESVFGVFISRITTIQQELQRVHGRLFGYMDRVVRIFSERIVTKKRLLQSLDPRVVLKRGYAVVRVHGTILTDSTKVDIGEDIRVQLHCGNITAEVKSKDSTKD